MRKGFSYIETLIALALFSIALLPLIPILSQANRNKAFSQEEYTAQLHAQGIMAVAKDAVVKDATVSAADIKAKVEKYVESLENPPCSYGVWYGEAVIISGGSGVKTTPSVNLNGLPGKAITVVCYGENGIICGRAVGVVPGSITNE